jgi:hypothetical protein
MSDNAVKKVDANDKAVNDGLQSLGEQIVKQTNQQSTQQIINNMNKMLVSLLPNIKPLNCLEYAKDTIGDYCLSARDKANYREMQAIFAKYMINDLCKTYKLAQKAFVNDKSDRVVYIYRRC